MNTSTQLKALIRNLSKEKNVQAEIILRNFMLERLLERISLSPFHDKYIARLIKENMSDQMTDMYRIEDILNHVKKVDINSYDMIGIGFPSYGFNPPAIVVDFIKKLCQVVDKKVFLFLTCAGPCYLNNVAFFRIKNILRRKGYNIIYEKVICMPANIFIKHEDEILKKIFDAAISKIEIMAKDISNNIVKVRNDRFFPYLFQWPLIIIERISIKSIPIDFTVGKECNRCMRCIQVCPRKNIKFKGKIKHGLKCEGCYRCVYSCPQKAIKGRLNNIAIHKEGYNIEALLRKTKDIKTPTQPLKGKYKSIASYFDS